MSLSWNKKNIWRNKYRGPWLISMTISHASTSLRPKWEFWICWMRSARCVLKGFCRERSSPVLLPGPPREESRASSQHWHCCLEGFGDRANKIGSYRRRRNGFSHAFSPLVSIKCLYLFLGLWPTFVLTRAAFSNVASLWSCHISPSCLVLGVSPFVFHLSWVCARLCAGDAALPCDVRFSGNPARGSCVSQTISAGGVRVLTCSVAAGSGSVPLGSRLQVCDTGSVFSVICVTPAGLHPRVLERQVCSWLLASLLMAALEIWGVGVWKWTTKCCPPFS